MSSDTDVGDGPKKTEDMANTEEDAEDNEDDEEDAEDDEEEEEEEGEEGGEEPEYIWLSSAEFHDPGLPYLFGAPVNALSTRTHSRRQKTAQSIFPHLADTLYRCKEYPHGIFIDSFGQLCPEDKRSGLYQIDERAAEDDEADEEMAKLEDTVAAKEAGLEEEEDDDHDPEDCDNDDAPPDARDVTWVKAENALRDKKGLKRKKVVPVEDDDDEDYRPESGADEDDEDEDDAEAGAELNTDDEFKDDELEGTEEDDEWEPKSEADEPSSKKSKKLKESNSDDEAHDDKEDEDESENEYEAEGPSPKSTRAPKVELTPEQRKAAYLQTMKDAETQQDNFNKISALRQQQRIHEQKHLRLLEQWSEDWKTIRTKVFREEKAVEKDLEKRKKIKNTSIQMAFEAHILSKDDPGCDFTFRKPVARAKKGEVQTGPKPVVLPPLTAAFDCATSEVVCGRCALRFAHMRPLYQHLSEHFVELKLLATLSAPAKEPALLGLLH